MARYPGSVPVLGTIAPNDDADTYPAIDPVHGIGGWREVADITARDAIPAARRRAGMVVYVQATTTAYILAADLTTWDIYSVGAGGSGDMLASVYDTNGNGIVDNSEALNGQAGSYYLDRDNHTGTQTVSTISDFLTQLQSVSATLVNKTITDYTNDVHANGLYYRVKAVVGVAKGAPVAYFGYNSGEDAIEVTLGNNATNVSIGLAAENIALGGFGQVIAAGILSGVNTGAYSVGTILFVDGAGVLTATQPTTGWIQPIAFVLRAHASNGALQVLADYPKQRADDVPVSVTGFGGILSAANTHVQSALDTIDDHTHAGLVTGGDTHDHSGGDGAQIAHTSLSSIGTNTHAQIDTHIASTNNPHGVTAAQAGADPTGTAAAAVSAHELAADPHPQYLTAIEGGAAYQPLDATLTAVAGVTTAADKLIYWTGVDTAAATTFTAAGRALLDDADAATMRNTLVLGQLDPVTFGNITSGISHGGARTLYISGAATGSTIGGQFALETALDYSGTYAYWYVGPIGETLRIYANASNQFRFLPLGVLVVNGTTDDGVNKLQVIGGIYGTGLDVNANIIRIRTAKTPASATDTGTAGQICWDANYIYVCTATNTWKRVAIASW